MWFVGSPTNPYITAIGGICTIVGGFPHLVTNVETWVSNPVLDDMPVEITYSDYKGSGGIKFSHPHYSEAGGQTTLDLTVTNVQAKVQNAALQVPDVVRPCGPCGSRRKKSPVACGSWQEEPIIVVP